MQKDFAQLGAHGRLFLEHTGTGARYTVEVNIPEKRVVAYSDNVFVTCRLQRGWQRILTKRLSSVTKYKGWQWKVKDIDGVIK